MPGKRQKRRPKKPEPEYYQIEVDNWDASYTFGANRSGKRFSEDYFESSYIFLNGKIVSPSLKKTDQARIMISSDHKLKDCWEQPSMEKPAELVGWITLLTDDSLLEFMVWLPPQSHQYVSSIAASGKIKYAWVYGTKLKYRQGQVYNLRISSYLEEDD